MATMTITVGDATSAIKKKAAPKPQLYSEHGVPKKPGDPPLGIAYDADGLPVPAHFSVRERSRTRLTHTTNTGLGGPRRERRRRRRDGS